MTDQSNNFRPLGPQQPSLVPQLITLSPMSSNQLPNNMGRSVLRSNPQVIMRTSANAANSPTLTRNLVLVRQPNTQNITQSTPRIVLQQGHRPILPQPITPTVTMTPQSRIGATVPINTYMATAPHPPPTIDLDSISDASARPLIVRNTPVGLAQTVRTVSLNGPQLGRAQMSSFNNTPARTIPSAESSVQPPRGREMQVRVCIRPDRKLSVLRSNTYDRLEVDGSLGGAEMFIQRENNLRNHRASTASSSLASISESGGANSEFGSAAREEARLRRMGINRAKAGYCAEDQPWLITVGKGRGAKRYRGVREGNVAASARYFVFCTNVDGHFDAYPVDEWYKLNAEVHYRYLREDEAEAEFSRRNKTLNLFNVMVKRKLGDDNGEEDESTGERGDGRSKSRSAAGQGSKSGGEKVGKRSGLVLTELDMWRDFDDDPEDETADLDEDGGDGSGAKRDDSGLDGASTSAVTDGDGGGGKGGAGDTGGAGASAEARRRKALAERKKRAAAIVARKRRATKLRARRRRKGARADSSDEEWEDAFDEACDESEPDDHEGDEVDYITDSSEDEDKLSEEDREQIYQEQGVDEEAGLRALLTDISDSEEEKEKKKLEESSNPEDVEDDEDAEEEDEEDGASDEGKKKKSGAGSSSKHKRKTNSGSSDSSDDSDDSSDDGSSSSDSSSSSVSEPDVAFHDDQAKKTAKKAELLQRISDKVSAAAASEDRQSIKRPAETDEASTTQNPTVKRPRTGNEAPVDEAFLAEVRKYLMRKPITVVDLLKKLKSKSVVLRSGGGDADMLETMLANALKQLRPLKHVVNGQSLLSLKR